MKKYGCDTVCGETGQGLGKRTACYWVSLRTGRRAKLSKGRALRHHASRQGALTCLRKLVPESQIRKMDEPADGLYFVSVWVIKFSKFCSIKNHNMLTTLWFTFLNRDDTLRTLIVQKSFSALVFHCLPRRHFHQRRWAQEKGSDPTGVGDLPARPGIAKA